jgi:hypothetical protein
MPRPHPECPLFVPSNCPDYRHPRICALVRGDRRCLHRKGSSRERIMVNGPGQAPSPHRSNILDRLETRRPKGTERSYMHIDRGLRELDR